MKVSRNNNNYFDVSVQMKEKTMRAICFSPEKMKPIRASLEASSPVKIWNYGVKRNSYTQEDEIHINKRTRLTEPDLSEVDFNVAERNVDQLLFHPVSDLVGNEAVGQVNIIGGVTFIGVPETVMSNGKTLSKQEAMLTDESGSIRIVLWEADIKRIESGSSYEFEKATVKNYNGENYITINRQTVVKSSVVEVARDDDERAEKMIEHKVSFPADGVEKVTSYLSCNKCTSSLIENDNRIFVKCANCDCAQLKSKCKKMRVAKVLLLKGEEKLTLTIFGDKLGELYNVYRKQSDCSAKAYDQLDEDDVIEFLLTVEAVVSYKNRLIVISIKCKDD